MRIDALASEPHFVDHLAPVWTRLPADVRGAFVVRSSAMRERAQRHGIEASLLGLREPITLVASLGDLRTADRPSILLNHGAGQTYRPPHPSYSGGPERDKVLLFLEPNQRTAGLSRFVYPDARVAIVGCPKLDRWVTAPAKQRATPPVVAISWHWNGQHVPEMGTAWPHYRDADVWKRLRQRYRIIGHGHPKIIDEIEPWYIAQGIEVARDFAEVLANADLFVCDNSSTLYEFAATDRPVVVLNAPWYRRNVEHGLRFWEYADVGYQVDGPQQLAGAISRALQDPPKQRERRERAVRAAYAHLDGNASARAVAAIVALLQDREVSRMLQHQQKRGSRIVRSAVRGPALPAGEKSVRIPDGHKVVRPPAGERRAGPRRRNLA